MRVGDELADIPKRVRRTLRTFALDRFEVTVGRFSAFVSDYASAREPPAGSGKHPGFVQSGWQEAWSASDGELPMAVGSLKQALQAHGEKLDWDGDITLPVRGVSWYLAMAFCIWDGARLPTEAEWAYAATGGEQREYPWPDEGNPAISHDRAVYSSADLKRMGPDPVGTHGSGQGLFGHEDLAGNLQEWVADSYEETLPASCNGRGDATLNEHECLQLDPGVRLHVMRGGAYLENADELSNRLRRYQAGSDASSYYGIRCARDVGNAQP
jgi:formylglycine-generating enzyme required for sulfatase activity